MATKVNGPATLIAALVHDVDLEKLDPFACFSQLCGLITN